MTHATIFSPCRKYRYTLWRTLAQQVELGAAPRPVIGYAVFIGLNPSTADETRDDPTIRRCMKFAQDWGYDALCMLNAFAWRDTLPAKMKAQREPIGAENDRYIVEVAKGAGVVVAAWGNHGAHLGRDKQVFRLLSQHGIKLHALRVTSTGSPQHPLYLPANTIPTPYCPRIGD